MYKKNYNTVVFNTWWRTLRSTREKKKTFNRVCLSTLNGVFILRYGLDVYTDEINALGTQRRVYGGR